MKRSKTVALTFMSAGAVMLHACDDPDVEGSIYRDLQGCLNAGELTPDQCQEVYRDARQEHQRTAPRYTSQEACYREYGYDQCQQQQTSSGGSFWMPLMMGYFAARAFNGGRNAQPLYRTAESPNTLRTANNRAVANSYGRTTLPGWATKASRSRTSAVSRGGFGRRSSGWGG